MIKSWPTPTSFYDATDVGIIFEMYFCPVKILNCTIFFSYIKILSIKGKVHDQEYFLEYLCVYMYNYIF